MLGLALSLVGAAVALDWSGGVVLSGQVDLPDGTRADETAGFGMLSAVQSQLFLASGPEGPALRLDLGLSGGAGWSRVALADPAGLVDPDEAPRQDARLALGSLVLGPQVWFPAPSVARVRVGAGAQAGLALVGVGTLASGEVEQALGGAGPHRTVQLRPEVDLHLRAEVRVLPRLALVVEPGAALCYTPPASLGPYPATPLAERRAFNLNLFRIGLGMRVLPPPQAADEGPRS